MSEITLNIDGREARGYDGQTVLEIARGIGIDIPTLCNDERVKMYGSCGVCTVEAEGNPRLLRSCSTMAADGMVIFTDTERVRKNRKAALELLLSDHTGDCRPPCALACPAETDCQGYVGLIANGQYHEALKLIKDKIPLPGSIGRICPHPCEEACRRKMVEEPISIAALKSFAADIDMKSGKLYTAEIAKDTGKKVAIIGGGPGGLSAAYFLRVQGHDVTIFDAMPQMGGMLRYGIPEYRLPKAYLQSEIDAIRDMGVEMRNNVKIGRDMSLAHLREQYDAVIVAVGAWTSAGMRCPSEELEGVVGGIDFLRGVSLGITVCAGKRVAVVGGGNTAMDACRTAIRLGAEKVYNIYRRTRAEMPAEDIEIEEAMEEGVEFKYLVNPIEIFGENGKAKSMRLQVMELGEPDASGRRAPVPVAGKEEEIEIDTVIAAIGQKLDPLGLDGIALTKWGTIAADEHTFRTNLDGVFAVGDATNKGADIAISAIGDAKKAAAIVGEYLFGKEAAYTAPWLVKSEPTAEDFTEYEKIPRAKMPHRTPEERKRDFREINHGYSEEQAKKDAARCLECGCHDYFECKLIGYANTYAVQPERLGGETHRRKTGDDHPFIHRNPDKCILCGLCVRICDEAIGATALGLVDRGFETIIKPALDLPLKDSGCISCGQCVHACPTGALTETMMIAKQVPTRELVTDTVCSFCGVGCKTRLTHTGDLLLRSLPAPEDGRDALLCMKGRFGFGEIAKLDRLAMPLIKNQAGAWEEITFENAYVHAAKKMQAVASVYGHNSIAVAVSDRYTNEEALMIREYAEKALHSGRIFSFAKAESGLSDTLGADASTADFDEMEHTELIILVGVDIRSPHTVAGLRVIKACNNGAKIIALNSFGSDVDQYASMRLDPGEDLTLLRQILKAVMETSGAGKAVPGYDALLKSLENVEIGDTAKAVAAEYTKAKKAIIMFEQNTLSADAAKLCADIALCAGHAFAPRSGIIQLKPGANAQGLADLGIGNRAELVNGINTGEIKGLFIFGEDCTAFDASKLEFLAVQDLQLTETARKAHFVLPASSYAEGGGTFTNSVGKIQRLNAAVPSPVSQSNFDILKGLCAACGYSMPYRSENDVILPEPPHRAEKALAVPKSDVLMQSVPNTNALYQSLMAFAEANGL